ncbi:MAG: transposase [Nocardioidaceae bacterium]
MVRTRDDLVRDAGGARPTSSSALLDAHWPGAKAIFADIESPIALAFLTPLPDRDRRRPPRRETAAPPSCTKHGYSGRRTAAELLTRLRDAPAGIQRPGPHRRGRRRGLGPGRRRSSALNTAIKTLDQLGDRPPRRAPGRQDLHVAAKVGSDQRRPGARRVGRRPAQAYDGPDAVAALAGVTPVTKESGKHRAVHFRWACNKRFRDALTTFADNSRHESAWAADVYTRARARHDHPHAIRILARAWVRVIYRCWNEGTPYDPNHHGGARRLAQAA